MGNVVPFAIRRADGRSDAQCVYDLVAPAAPRRLFLTADLLACINAERHRPLTRQRLSSVISSVNRRLLRLEQHCLSAVPGVGYRILEAHEHVPKALKKKRDAERQLHAGLELLRHVRQDELTPAQRQVNEAHLLLFTGLYAMVRETQRRQARYEQALDELRASLFSTPKHA